MEYVHEHSCLFRRPARRRRVTQLVLALGALTLLNAAALVSANAQDDAFMRLGAKSSSSAAYLSEDGRGVYAVVGGNERFEFTRSGRKGSIRFLCNPSPRCTDEMRRTHSLSGEPGGRGSMVFKSKSGVPVLRITATGGATILGGASFVPSSIPKSGRAIAPSR